MGGRGSSSGGGSANAATSVVTQSGHTADLTNNPLIYGKQDKALSGTSRTVIEAFESKYKGRKTEYGILVDKDGKVLHEAKGGKGSVSMPTFLYSKAESMSHIHPRTEDGVLGGTFSRGDMDAFSKFDNLKSMSASAAEGTYRISKGDNFDKAGFHQWVKQATADYRKNYDKEANSIIAEYKAGNIKYSQLEKDLAACFNKHIVGLHNTYAANAKKYGFNYTLERWKSK